MQDEHEALLPTLSYKVIWVMGGTERETKRENLMSMSFICTQLWARDLNCLELPNCFLPSDWMATRVVHLLCNAPTIGISAKWPTRRGIWLL